MREGGGRFSKKYILNPIMPTQPHQASVTRLKSSTAFQNSYLFTTCHSALPNISIMSKLYSECCFLCKSNWNLGNCSIDKDMPFDILTYMTFTISFSVIAFFHWNSLVKLSHNAECNMTKTLRVFIIRLVACEITAKHEIIFGLDNLSKALHILRNHLVRLKACLENQISCTGLMIVK